MQTALMPSRWECQVSTISTDIFGFLSSINLTYPPIVLLDQFRAFKEIFKGIKWLLVLEYFLVTPDWKCLVFQISFFWRTGWIFLPQDCLLWGENCHFWGVIFSWSLQSFMFTYQYYRDNTKNLEGSNKYCQWGIYLDAY